MENGSNGQAGGQGQEQGQTKPKQVQPKEFPENKALSTVQPGLQVIWDATSLSALKECPRKYYLGILCGYQPKTNAVALNFGILFHAALEGFYKRAFTGCSYEENLRETLRGIALDPLRAELQEANDPVRGVETLVRVLVEYLDFYHDEPAETVVFPGGDIGAELHFQYETGLVASTGESFAMAGNLDRVVKMPTGLFIMDHKTTSMALSQFYFQQYDLDTQMTNYAIAADVVFGAPVRGVIIDGVKIKGQPEFSRYMTMRSKEACDEWLGELQHWFRLAEYFAQVDCWPANDKSCNKFSGCPFREVCKAPKNLRKRVLEEQFKQRTWDPSQEKS